MAPTMRKFSPNIRINSSLKFFLLGFVFIIFNILWLNIQLSQTQTSNAVERSLQQKMGTNQEQQQQRQRQPDGFFNGYPVYYFNLEEEEEAARKSLRNNEQQQQRRQRHYYYSSSHCIGENYQSKTSWMHRSCRYTFFCFDMEQEDFVVFGTPNEESMSQLFQEVPFSDVSQGLLHPPSFYNDSNNNDNNNNNNHDNADNHSYSFSNQNRNSNAVSLGGINVRWTMNDDGIPRLKWSPRVVITDQPPKSFYALDSNVVMIPFHSLAGDNPGHLVWDDFLPIYTLLTMFNLEDQQPLLLRYVLRDGQRGLWASCDFTDKKRIACAKMHSKFWPLMRTASDNSSNHSNTNQTTIMTSTKQFELTVPQNKSNYICARHGLAGIGALTDHGTDKKHGWENRDYTITHNHGRAPVLWNFRQYTMKNVGIQEDSALQPPFKIVFSMNSSSRRRRNINFGPEVEFLKTNLDPNLAVVEQYWFPQHSLTRQLEIASQAAIFITGCGGGAVTAMFVPKGAAIFAYFSKKGGLDGMTVSGEPARLDWDLLNNLGYAHVNWMPTEDMSTNRETLLILVRNELDRIQQENGQGVHVDTPLIENE